MSQHQENETSALGMRLIEEVSKCGRESDNASDEVTTAAPGSPREILSEVNSLIIEGVPSKNSLLLMHGVAVHGPHEDPGLPALIRQARSLSDAALGRDCLQDITKKSHWKLTLLTTQDLSVLCGFIILKVVNGCLSIADIAVNETFRRHGFGKMMMEDALKTAKKRGDVYEVCLSALPTAVRFYQRLGFKSFDDIKIETNQENLIEGQVYMEKKLRQRPRQRRR